MLETKTAPAVKRDKKTETDPANQKTLSKNNNYSCNRFSGSIGALSNSNDCWIDCIEIYDTKADGMNQQTTQKSTERNSIEQKVACNHF